MTSASRSPVRPYWLCRTYEILENDRLRNHRGDLAHFGFEEGRSRGSPLYFVSFDEE